MKYIIALHGCNDSTIFEMELTEEEYKLVKKIADKSEEVSTYGCMPIMEIKKV